MTVADWMPAIVAVITVFPPLILAVVQVKKLRAENTSQHAENGARVEHMESTVLARLDHHSEELGRAREGIRDVSNRVQSLGNEMEGVREDVRDVSGRVARLEEES